MAATSPVPVGLAAVTLRIPLVLSEADSHLGLTNRVLAPSRGACAWRSRCPDARAQRYRVTGRPVPPPRRIAPRAGAVWHRGGGDCVLVFGGSLGARSINMAAIEAFAARRASHVLHVAGRRDYPELAARDPRAGYDLREYLDLEAFADALAAADLVVARAGGSVFEIAAHGCPRSSCPIRTPLADHQSANARWMAEAGAAMVIADGELTAARLARRRPRCWRTAAPGARWRPPRAAWRGRRPPRRWPGAAGRQPR